MTITIKDGATLIHFSIQCALDERFFREKSVSPSPSAVSFHLSATFSFRSRKFSLLKVLTTVCILHPRMDMLQTTDLCFSWLSHITPLLGPRLQSDKSENNSKAWMIKSSQWSISIWSLAFSSSKLALGATMVLLNAQKTLHAIYWAVHLYIFISSFRL